MHAFGLLVVVRWSNPECADQETWNIWTDGTVETWIRIVSQTVKRLRHSLWYLISLNLLPSLIPSYFIYRYISLHGRVVETSLTVVVDTTFKDLSRVMCLGTRVSVCLWDLFLLIIWVLYYEPGTDVM